LTTNERELAQLQREPTQRDPGTPTLMVVDVVARHESGTLQVRGMRDATAEDVRAWLWDDTRTESAHSVQIQGKI
jgi:hypothetical protein